MFKTFENFNQNSIKIPNINLNQSEILSQKKCSIIKQSIILLIPSNRDINFLYN